MTNNYKYFLSEGCCICGTKHSTSQFRPWYEHYPEETFCRVFRMPTLQGRRGHLCNPCVLFIKRTVQSMDSNTLNSDPRKRLDLKLKGCRRSRVPDMYPPGSSQAPREMGYFARTMRITPKYVYTTKRYIKLKSMYQLIPAGEWQDPRLFLEDESDAEEDLPYYRRVTLKKGVKTLHQKLREKVEAEARENQILFGEPNPFGEEHAEDTILPCRAIAESRSKIRVPKHTNLQNGQPDARTYGTRANVLKGKVAIKEGNSSRMCNEDDEDTDTSDELIDGEEDSLECQDETMSVSSNDVEPGAISNRVKRKREEEDNDVAFSSMEQVGDKIQSLGIERRKAESNTNFPVRKRNRRVLRNPVKNFKRPTVSFMDCSYWQKFPLCCVTVYVGEGGHCVLQPHLNMKQCPYAQRKLQQLQQSIEETQSTSFSGTCSASSTTTRSASFSNITSTSFIHHRRPRCTNTKSTSFSGTRSASFFTTQSARFSGTRNTSSSTTQSAGFSGTHSASSTKTQSAGFSRSQRTVSSNDTSASLNVDTQSTTSNDYTRSASPNEDTRSASSLDGFRDEDISSLKEADEESEAESTLSSELQHNVYGASTSSQDDLPDSDGGAGKEAGADRVSVISSGEDELNDTRASCSSSPLIEKPCNFFM